MTVSCRYRVGGVVAIHADIGTGNGARTVGVWDPFLLHRVIARALCALGGDTVGLSDTVPTRVGYSCSGGRCMDDLKHFPHAPRDQRAEMICQEELCRERLRLSPKLDPLELVPVYSNQPTRPLQTHWVVITVRKTWLSDLHHVGSLSRKRDACADRGEDRPGDRNDRNNDSEIESSLSV